MVKFFERLGHKVIRTQSSWWYDVQPGVLLTLPYYKQITPSENEINELLKKENLRALRYPTTLENFGFLSDITINTHKDYDLPHLHQKARNQTKRGLENCQVRPMDFEELAKDGLALNIDTAARQERKSQFCSQEYWERYCRAAGQTDGMHAWGAYYQGQLASFLIAVEAENNWVEWIVNHSSTHLRDKYANNALAFSAGQFFLNEKKFDGICYGLGSLEDTTYLDHFKTRMGWELKPIKQRLVFSKKLKLVVSMAPKFMLKTAKTLFPKSYTVRKSSAMIRLYNKQTYDVPQHQGAIVND